VNSNGRHQEVGAFFLLGEDQLDHWKALARCSR
jgi:hypothetical protein